MILAALRSRERLDAIAASIRAVNVTDHVRLMEVCGGHTAVIHRYALPYLLPDNIELVSGPGCPVCVTEDDFVDECIALAGTPGVAIVSFGDLVRVPGSAGTLAEARARGADVRIFYSPASVLGWANAEPETTFILAGIGFETTACTIAAVIHDAAERGLRNLRLLSALKTMPAALRALLADEETHVDGLILPGHVMTVTGTASFQFLAQELHVPCAVSGFEPADLLSSVLNLVHQIKARRATIDIQYSRSVKPGGNVAAQAMIDRVFESCTAVWRGLGDIPGSGLKLRPVYAHLAANPVVQSRRAQPRSGCGCGEILRGRMKPHECALFGTECTPDHPRGACMVSSEGACASVFQYVTVEQH